MHKNTPRSKIQNFGWEEHCPFYSGVVEGPLPPHLSHISSLVLAWCKEGTVSQVLSYW